MSPALFLAAALAAPPEGPAPVRLTVAPMAAPKPALRYQLLPEVRELTPGNPVQWYLRCFAEQRNFFFGKEAVAERAKYRSVPLAELPADKLRGYGGSALTQADWGARLDTPDWEVLSRVQTEGTELVLPELEPLRVLGTALQVRFRGEVARRDFDAAARTAKTMFALARHLGECPVSAANRLGVSIAGFALDTLEEMLQQPGCPNLYWALTDLPVPLVDFRKGVQGDRARADAELRAIRDDVVMTDEQLDAALGEVSGRAGAARERAGRPPVGLRARVAEVARDPGRRGAARARLIEAGYAADLVGQFLPVQVVLLDEKREYEARRDDEMRLLGLAPWQIDALTHDPTPGSGLFTELVPRVAELRRVQARLEQRIALLRHVEALRLYAAAHGGELPPKLAAVGVPLPVDPFTGKPVAYTVEGATARLRGAPPKAEEKDPAWNGSYEVAVRK